MTALAVVNPFAPFLAAGAALSGGKIYIGEPSKDPIAFPVPVYWDEALTIAALQPLRTSGGYIWRNGAPGRPYVEGDCSVLVLDANDQQVFYSATSGGLLLSAFAKTLLDDANAAEARATLGATSVGDALFIAADMEAARAALGAYSLLAVQRFATPGSSTYTPTAGTRAVLVELVGGGGAGGGGAATGASTYSAGGGGGAGGFASSFLTSDFSGANVTVGAGGAAVSGSGVGGSGGNSSFGASLSATGGTGGPGGSAIAVSAVSDIQTALGGAGGVGSGGNIANSAGASGGHAFYLTRPMGGTGGQSRFGGGAAGRVNLAIAGNAGVSPGSGGGGVGLPTSDSARPGGAGAAGLVVVYEFG